LKGDGCSELSAARNAGVYASLDRALRAAPEQTLEIVHQSGVRGRGGAGFPTGRKWRTCAQAPGDRKYVVANGDEGDPGSFIDRELMERDPHTIIEGMLLAAHVVGAREGIVFIRSEYPHAIRVMQRAVEQAREAGLLGPARCDRAFALDVRIVNGLGSYVCGEETALLNAIEGKRGEARPRPPYPAEQGLYGRPTVVDNVETLVNVPWIVRNGAAAYRAMGTAACPGTKALCLNRGFARPGIVEVEFGISLRHVIDELAGGAATGKQLEAVLLGGPMGSFVLPPGWDAPVCIHAMAQRGIRLGHGGIVAIPHGTDYAALLRHLLEFMAEESCGKCVPCRIGTKRALELVQDDGLKPDGPQRLVQIFDLMEQTSLCGFGRETPGPVRQLLEYFGPRVSKAVGR
jgi:NADH-quinone oxidoreductase subunit F